MARKTLNYTVTDDNRDKGKVFVITEMPASRAEAWATRALFALMENDVEMPEGFENMGMAGMAQMGFEAIKGLRWEVAEPLLEEMFECVQYMPDKSKPHVIRNLFEEDIEEVMTRVKLRGAVWEVHTGFSVADAITKFRGKALKAEAEEESLPNTETSHQ